MSIYCKGIDSSDGSGFGGDFHFRVSRLGAAFNIVLQHCQTEKWGSALMVKYDAELGMRRAIINLAQPSWKFELGLYFDRILSSNGIVKETGANGFVFPSDQALNGRPAAPIDDTLPQYLCLFALWCEN